MSRKGDFLAQPPSGALNKSVYDVSFGNAASAFFSQVKE